MGGKGSIFHSFFGDYVEFRWEPIYLLDGIRTIHNEILLLGFCEALSSLDAFWDSLIL